MAKSLAAYTKNHYPTGQSFVNCSQHPLNPPLPVSPTISKGTKSPADDVADVPLEGSTIAPSTTDDGIVTDIVPEQIGEGSSEPAPTPAAGEREAKAEEMDQPGGLETVDKAVEEVKEEQEQDMAEASPSKEADAVPPEGGDAKAVEDAPEVVEVPGSETLPGPEEEAKVADSTESVIATEEKQPERKQERIENPIYTLEIVGDRYKTDAFW